MFFPRRCGYRPTWTVRRHPAATHLAWSAGCTVGQHLGVAPRHRSPSPTGRAEGCRRGSPVAPFLGRRDSATGDQRRQVRAGGRPPAAENAGRGRYRLVLAQRQRDIRRSGSLAVEHEPRLWDALRSSRPTGRPSGNGTYASGPGPLIANDMSGTDVRHARRSASGMRGWRSGPPDNDAEGRPGRGSPAGQDDGRRRPPGQRVFCYGLGRRRALPSRRSVALPTGAPAIKVRQSVRVEDHGASGAPTSFRELAVDHILLATTDLGAASQALSDRIGLQGVEGGRHPGWGTANWIVPVGDAYLELVAVVDERIAERSAFGRWVARADAALVKPIGWAVRTGSLDAVATRLGLTVHAGSRATPSGERLTWRLAGIERAAAEPISSVLHRVGRRDAASEPGPRCREERLSRDHPIGPHR